MPVTLPCASGARSHTSPRTPPPRLPSRPGPRGWGTGRRRRRSGSHQLRAVKLAGAALLQCRKGRHRPSAGRKCAIGGGQRVPGRLGNGGGGAMVRDGPAEGPRWLPVTAGRVGPGRRRGALLLLRSPPAPAARARCAGVRGGAAPAPSAEAAARALGALLVPGGGGRRASGCCRRRGKARAAVTGALRRRWGGEEGRAWTGAVHVGC